VSKSEETYAQGMVYWTGDDDQAIDNYSLWQFELIEQFIGQSILEVGVGTGRIALQILRKLPVSEYCGVEPSTQHFADLKRIFANVEQMKLLNATIEEVPNSERGRFDTFLSTHVLEHIEDDLGFLRQASEFVRPGGKLVIVVPAVNWLMSQLDRNIGHFRRYDRKMTQALAHSLGFRIVTNRYSNFVGFWGWLVICKLMGAHYQGEGKESFLSKLKLFDRMVPILKRIEKIVVPPIGLNLILVLEKPRDAAPGV
jgi:SAM-dependent methyltransferase